MAAELKIGIGADNSGLKQGLQDAEAQISAFVSKVNKIAQVGEQLSSIGQKMSVGLTLPIAGLATASLNAFKELEGVRVAFKRLNDPTLLDELRKATKNTTSDLQLMQSAVSAEKFGLSTSALPKLLEYARRVAKDTGQSVDYLVDSIVTGIGRKSPLILDNLGISATSLKEALGGVSMEAASVGEVTEAVAKIAQRELQKMGADANTLAESWAQVRTSISNSLSRIGEIINKNFDISGVTSKISEFINKAVSAFENLSPAIQKSILVVTGLVAAAGPLLVIVGGFLSALPTILTGLGALKVAFLALTSPIGLVVVGIGAIIAAVVSNWDKIRPYIEGTINWFRKLYNESALVRGGVETIYLAFAVGFKGIAGILRTGWEVIKSFAKLAADAFASLGDVILGVLTFKPDTIAKGLVGINAAIGQGVRSIWNDLKVGFNQVTADFARLGGESVKRFQNGISSEPISLAPVKQKIKEETEKAVIGGVTEGIESGKSKLGAVQIELPDLEVIQGKGSKGYMDSLGNEFENWWDIDSVTSKISATMKAAAAVTAMGLSNIRTTADPFLEDLTNRFNKAFEDLTKGALSDGISDAFNSIGEAIGSGGNLIQEFGKSVLMSFGNFLSDLGKLMIQYGVAAALMGKLEAVLIASPDPASKIAAGLAMAAAGAALATIGGAIRGAVSGRGSSGGSVPSGGGTSSQSYSSTFSSGGGAGGGEVVFRISGNDLVGVLSRQQDKNTRLGG